MPTTIDIQDPAAPQGAPAVPAVPAAPAPAQAPAPAPTVSVTPGQPGVFQQTGTQALSRDQVANLRSRRSELSNQLQSAEGRRNRLVEQMQQATGVERSGLEQRVQLLDQRILQIEADISETGRQLTSSGVALESTSQSAGGDDYEDVAVAFGFVSFFLFVMLAWTYLRLRKVRKQPARPALADPGGERMERLEQAVDTIAVEIERISEGQRFVTNLLSGAQPGMQSSQRVPEPARALRGDPLR